MLTKSCKAKARRLQNYIAEIIRNEFMLSESDVRPAIMGELGMDIKLSEAAREHFPFAVEAKNQEKLNIWSAYDQAIANSESGLTPVVIFKRNRSSTLVTLSFNDFIDILSELHRLTETQNE